VSRSPNVRGARRQLTVKLRPQTVAKLGAKPSTKAAEVLDAWASNASSDVDESAPLEGGPPCQARPGRLTGGEEGR
jgi:hypothetical protein